MYEQVPSRSTLAWLRRDAVTTAVCAPAAVGDLRAPLSLSVRRYRPSVSVQEVTQYRGDAAGVHAL